MSSTTTTTSESNIGDDEPSNKTPPPTETPADTSIHIHIDTMSSENTCTTTHSTHSQLGLGEQTIEPAEQSQPQQQQQQVNVVLNEKDEATVSSSLSGSRSLANEESLRHHHEESNTTAAAAAKSIAAQKLNRWTQNWRQQAQLFRPKVAAGTSKLFSNIVATTAATTNFTAPDDHGCNDKNSHHSDGDLKRTAWTFPLQQSAKLTLSSQDEAQNGAIQVMEETSAINAGQIPSTTTTIDTTTSDNQAPCRSHSLESTSLISSGDDDDDDDDDSSSYNSGSAVGSSFYGSTDDSYSHAAPSSTTSGVSALQWAAASVVDSVQLYRGRYSNTNNNSSGRIIHHGINDNNTSNLPTTPHTSNRHGHNHTSTTTTTTTTAAPATQVSRILSSPAREHFERLQSNLALNEYIMLLGRGMLGVNLKQSYQKHAGVYVDFMVRQGAAEKCGVVQVGDVVKKVGNVSTDRGTIWTVPSTIAAAKRPVHLVLSTCGATTVDQIRHLDVAVAAMQICSSILLLASSSSSGDEEGAVAAASNEAKIVENVIDDDRKNNDDFVNAPAAPLMMDGNDTRRSGDVDNEEKQGVSTIESTDQLNEEEHEKEEGAIDARSLEGQTGNASSSQEEDDEMKQDEDIMKLVTPPSFDKEDDSDAIWRQIDRVEVKIEPLESFEAFVNPGAPPLTVRQLVLPHVIKRNNDEQLRSHPLSDFLQFSNVVAASLNAFLTCVIDGRCFVFLARYFAELDARIDQEPRPTSSGEGNPAASSSNAMLMSFLEMMNFTDLHGVMPHKRRLDFASRIAHKYFLPVTVGSKKELVPPMFDFHQIVGHSSLRQLEAALSEGRITYDLFWDFQHAVAINLSGRPFLSFLTSNECARMRAYLRNTAPFVNVPLHAVIDSLVQESLASSESSFSPTSAAAKNYFLYILSYLVCLTDNEPFGEHDDLATDPSLGAKPEPGNRVEDAASGLCCALFIRARVVPAIQKGQVEHLHCVLEQLWETYVAPGVGALSRRSQAGELDGHLKAVVQKLQGVREKNASGDSSIVEELIHSLRTDESFLVSVQTLADELLYEYASSIHPKFRIHKFHEWMCDEINKASEEDSGRVSNPGKIPLLPGECVKRLLRKADWPVGIAPHKPSHDVLSLDAAGAEKPDTASASASAQVGGKNEILPHCNAECAIIFGTSIGSDQSPEAAAPGMSDASSIRRYCCQSAHLGGDDSAGSFLSMEIPAILESYALVPESRSKPFEVYSRLEGGGIDGWEASLVSFVVPRADVSTDGGGESSLYGVSLVLRQTDRPYSTPFLATKHHAACEKEESAALRKIKASISSPAFSRRLAEQTWTERIAKQDNGESERAVVGLALVSQRNVILAMRETLSLLFREFGRSAPQSDLPTLVDLLGNFAHDDVEDGVLLSVLEPFLRQASSPWLEKPVAAQKHAFEQVAGMQLIKSIPPIPLALLFVTALLEQKIVLTSSRRSVVLSSTVALSALLKPLNWCHLLVPRVPVSLAADLLQYPAPYILGMPSEDQGIMELIRTLPEDVTLVDLDVGRVILAPSFAHDSELGRGTPNNADTARALRSQVLYLAQSLGSVFGSVLEPEVWMCDSPCITATTTSPDFSPLRSSSDETRPSFDALKSVCRDFVEELLADTASCCYWIEEAFADTSKKTEPTILFDEDRFFHIKNVRQKNGFDPLFRSSGCAKKKQGLALSLDNFDLVLELFLRCQSMNAYIGTRDRSEMAFSL